MKKAIILLYILVWRVQLKDFVRFWALYFNEDIVILETMQRRSTSMIRDLENAASEIERIALF